MALCACASAAVTACTLGDDTGSGSARSGTPDGGDDGAMNTPDGGDASIDAGRDALVDVSVTDASVDMGSEGASDATLDAGIDAAADTGTDSTADAGTDAIADAGVDVGNDVGADASPDAGSVGSCGFVWCLFQPQPSGVSAGGAYSVWASSSNDIYVSDQHWNGSTWSALSLPAPNYHYYWTAAFAGTAADDVWVFGGYTGTAGYISPTWTHWDGSAWSNPIMLGVSPYVFGGAWATGRGDLWWTASGGALYPRFCHGSGQVASAPSTTTTIAAVWGSAANDIWVTGSPHALHWDGVALTSQSGAPSDGQVWGAATNDVWIASSAAYHYDGASWSQMPAPSVSASGIWGSASNDVWIANHTGGILHWDGATWTQSTTETPSNHDVRAVVALPTGIAFAVTANGELLQHGL